MARRPADKSLSASDIFDQLHGSSNSSLVFTGLIDRVPNDEHSVRFARVSDDPDWATIPTSAIDKVQFVRPVRGKGGSYPLAHVFFKEPQSDEGRAFAAVASLHRPVAQLGSFGPSASITCPDGYEPKYDEIYGWRCYPKDRP